MKSWLECIICGKKYSLNKDSYICDNCKEIHQNKYGHLLIKSRSNKKQLVKPFKICEGNTPILKLKNPEFFNVWIKNEGLNPSGSFKDRSTSFMISQALSLRKNRVCCASSGNAAVSLAMYSYKAGIDCEVVVPKRTSEEKLELLELFKAKVKRIDGCFEDCYEYVTELLKNNDYYDCRSGINPFALEGCKEIAYEIVGQIGVPDKVVIPVGDGTNLSGIWKGFKEMKLSGKIKTTPKIISVQIEDADPLTQAFKNNKEIFIVKNPVESIAEGIVAKESYCILHAIKSLKESDGFPINVTDKEIINAIKVLLKEGILAEPTSASVIAAVNKMKKNKLLNKRERIVCILTGSGLKTIEEIKKMILNNSK